MSNLQVSVYRYNPETDSAPYMQEFQVDTKGRDLMVLDVLHLMKEQDSGLAYRRSCREGVCGSDGMNMNGKNGLACITPLSDVVKNNKLTLRPLPGLPVIRDMVVDMGLFYKQYERIQPYLQNDTPGTGHRAPAVAGRARQTGRPIRMYSVRVLLHIVPVVLVESGQIRGSCWPAAILPLPGRQPRYRNP